MIDIVDVVWDDDTRETLSRLHDMPHAAAEIGLIFFNPPEVGKRVLVWCPINKVEKVLIKVGAFRKGSDNLSAITKALRVPIPCGNWIVMFPNDGRKKVNVFPVTEISGKLYPSKGGAA